jgi:hypothetical protein
VGATEDFGDLRIGSGQSFGFVLGVHGPARFDAVMLYGHLRGDRKEPGAHAGTLIAGPQTCEDLNPDLLGQILGILAAGCQTIEVRFHRPLMP